MFVDGYFVHDMDRTASVQNVGYNSLLRSVSKSDPI